MKQAPSEILVATSNAGKIREIRQALAGMRVRLLTPDSRGPLVEPEETGATFADNARLKATSYAQQTGLLTLAEDSGLVIDALGGRPGVWSARYPGATYPDKFRRLYAELGSASRPWTARFVSAIALVDPAHPNPPTFECEGVAEGEIAPAPRGGHGFGYDPIFIYAPTGRTGGELSDEEKLAVSHRGKALARLRVWWTATFSD